VFKIMNGGAVGRLALARVMGDGLEEGSELDVQGDRIRVGALFTVQGDKTTKVAKAGCGEVVAIAKADGATAGLALDVDERFAERALLPVRNAAIAIETADRKDDVKLSTALHKMVEEDPSLGWTQDDASHQTLLRGVNDEHLSVTLARLKRRYGVEVVTHPPRVAYRESIRQSVQQRGRHKKQSGGHGQYGDVVIDIRPLPRGGGFVFEDKVTGGVVPRQWIPAVEAGIRDAMQSGPLGFAVVDVAVALVDGSHHSVDSSEVAFRIAGRMAMADALAQASPYLLEPIHHLTVSAPPGTGSKMGSAVSARRGQILSMGAHPRWERWEQIEAHIPEASLHGLDAEIRSLSHGLAAFEAKMDHLSELAGKAADQVVKSQAGQTHH
jgi:elongation factor G